LPYPETSPGIAVCRLDEFITDLANPTAVATATIPRVAVNRGVYFYRGKHVFFLFVSGHTTNPTSSP
jgi:hypothetical protein